MAALVTIAAIGIVVPLVLILGYVIFKGVAVPAGGLLHHHVRRRSGPNSPASQTGGLQAIVGTLEQVGIADADQRAARA